MNADESLERFGLVPTDEALPRIRMLLAQEAELERRGKGQEREGTWPAFLHSALSRGRLQDLHPIWDANDPISTLVVFWTSRSATRVLVETKKFLSSQTNAEAKDALKYLDACERAGDFIGFEPQEHLAHYRRLFG